MRIEIPMLSFFDEFRGGGSVGIDHAIDEIDRVKNQIDIAYRDDVELVVSRMLSTLPVYVRVDVFRIREKASPSYGRLSMTSNLSFYTKDLSNYFPDAEKPRLREKLIALL